MAVQSLKFQSNTRLPEETKAGFVVWNGNAADYPYWKFRTSTKFFALKHAKKGDYEPKVCEVMVSVTEALRGDALTVAMNIGMDKLLSPGMVDDGKGGKMAEGHYVIMQAMQEKVFPLVDEEAKAMYTEFHTVGSSFSRQPSETMLAYVQRRRRCFDLLKELDAGRANLSEDMLGDMMLDNARINKTEKLLILTSTGNRTNIDAIEEALKRQHSKIHKSEYSRQGSRRGDYRSEGKKDYGGKKKF